MKHSPAPWKVIDGWNDKGDGQYFPSVIINKKAFNNDSLSGRIVINVSHDQQKTSLMANARLIASAPELLEALKWAMFFVRELRYVEQKEKQKQIIELIEKIEGKQ